MPYLAFNLNNGNEFVFDILEERLSIGRDTRNDIVIDNTYISGFHAEFIRHADGVYELLDLKSSNGTFVNGQRIERSRVKGGDKIRFGQLDSRFRERAPKGTAPAAEIKSGKGSKSQAPNEDGHPGDTESIPARDAQPKDAAGPIEPTNPPLGPSDSGGNSPATTSLPIRKPDVHPDSVLLQQTEELREEMAKLRLERDLLRTENDKESALRDKVRALEKTLEQRQRESEETTTKLTELKADVSAAQAEVAKLVTKRREAGNLDSQVETNRSELAKVQSDIGMATSGLQSLHRDADKVRADRLEVSKQLEDLRAQIQQSEVRSQDLASKTQELEVKAQEYARLVVDSEKSESELKSRQSSELQEIEARISARKLELSQLEISLTGAQKAVQSTQSEAESSVTKLRAEKQSLEQQVEGLQQSISEGQSGLGNLEKQRSLLGVALAVLLSRRQSSESEVTALTARSASALQQYEATLVEQYKAEACLIELRQQFSQTEADHDLQRSQACSSITALEESIRSKTEQFTQLEARETELQNKLCDLSKTGAKEAQTSTAVQVLDAQKSELTTVVTQLSKQRDALQLTVICAQAKQEAELAELESRRAEVAKLDTQIPLLESTMVDLTAQVQRLKDAHSMLSDTESALMALEIQKTELVDSIAEIKLQHEEFTKQAKLSEATKLAKEQALEQSIDAKTNTLATLDSKVSQLEVKEADLTNKLNDLAGKNVLLSNATEALKGVESHKAELLSAITQMTAERDMLTRDVLTGAEKGRAQHKLTQTLIARLEAVEKEMHASEEQQATVSFELGKVREGLRVAESAFETKQKDLNEAEACAESLRKQVEETTKQQAKLQQEVSEWSAKLTAAKTDLEVTSANTQEKVKAAEEVVASHAQHSTQLTELQTKIRGLEVLLATLEAAHLEKETQLNTLESQQRGASDLLTIRQQEITAEETRLSELRSLTTIFDLRVAELSATEKKLNEAKGAEIKATQDMDKAQSETKRLQDERADHEKRLPTLRAESEMLQSNLAIKLKELVMSDARLTGLNQQVKDLDVRLKEMKAAEVAMEKTQLEVTRLTGERDTINLVVATLLTQREDHEKILPGLRADVDVLRTELRTLTQGKQATVNALEKVQAERNSVSEQAVALRTEVTQLEKLLNDRRGTLEAETKTKLAEANQAETKLHEVIAKVAAAEKRAIELAEIEKRLSSATSTLKDTENQLLAEEKALATLAGQQEKTRKDLAMLEESTKSTQMQISELTKKAKAEETRYADSVMLAEKFGAALQAVEAKRAEAEAALTKAREEERNLRKNIPALNTEMAGLQAALTTLTRDREEASQYVSRLNVTTEGSNRKLSELQQQISQLEEAHRLREERVIKAQADVDNEGARLKAAQEQTRAAEVALQDLERQVKEGRQKAEATRTLVTNQEAELSLRLDRVQSLKTDEERLNKQLATRQQEIQEAETNVAELHNKISSEQKRVVEFTHVGGQVLTIGAALASLETRQGETARSLRDAAERELALQVKINALQESYNRESARLEEVKKNRLGIEADMATFVDKSQKQMTSLKAVEGEQQKRLTDVEKHLHEQATLFERVKSELAGLQDRRADFAQAEAQFRHWQEIEARLRGQLLELEEKHEIMRRGLPTDEATVVMFANDLIKRIDLIDALTARYSGHSGSDVVTQLGTLRASFEDILFQHGVSEFDIAVGTEVDTQLRKRIAVVDSLPGKEKPRVVETCRSGFMYSREEGHEVVLRKVEVRTSSQ